MLVNLSGRGDKDVDTAATWFGVVSDEEIVESATAAVTEGAQDVGGRGLVSRPSTQVLPPPAPRAGPRWSATCPAGYPSVDGRRRGDAPRWSTAGVDVVEVGLPYSDPLMDGPTIQAAVEAALRSGTTTDDVLGTVASGRRDRRARRW